MAERIRVGNGRIALTREVYSRYLGRIEAVALTEIDGVPHILPLRGAAAGGRLVKQRNLAGDRVIEAGDFLTKYGLGEFSAEREASVQWSATAGALRIDGLEAKR